MGGEILWQVGSQPLLSCHFQRTIINSFQFSNFLLNFRQSFNRPFYLFHKSNPSPKFNSRLCVFCYNSSPSAGLADMQNQFVCSGCRTVLLYPPGATNVCCAICNMVTAVPPAGMDMAQLICGGCRTLLMHARGAASVRCSCCHTVNLVPAPSHVAHINCGNCHTMLMYPAGAPSVRCAICHYITNTNMGDTRIHIPVHRHSGNSTSTSTPPTSTASAQSHNQTVVVQNPMTVDESGKLVSNVVVGVTT